MVRTLIVALSLFTALGGWARESHDDPAPTKDQLIRVDGLALTLTGFAALRSGLKHLNKTDTLWVGTVALALQARSGLSIDAPGWVPLARYAIGDLKLNQLPPRILALVEDPKKPGDIPFVIAAHAEPVVWRATLQHWLDTVRVRRNTQLLAQVP